MLWSGVGQLVVAYLIENHTTNEHGDVARAKARLMARGFK